MHKACVSGVKRAAVALARKIVGFGMCSHD